MNVQSLLVGRPGLDHGTLRVFPERPGTSISVQICWPDEVQWPPTSTEVLQRLTSWLDNWLDPGSFQGQVTFQSTVGGRLVKFTHGLVTNRTAAIHADVLGGTIVFRDS